MFKTAKLKQAIEDSGLSYAELDRRMGTVNTVSKYANGTRKPMPPTLADFLRHLGWDERDIRNQCLGDWYELATTAASDTSG